MPVYNEEGSIKQVVRLWTDALKSLKINFEIHAYNDGSRDSSLLTLKEIAKNNPFLFVHDKPNSGHGPTVIQGFRENLDAQWMFQIDSDNELGPDEFSVLWKNRLTHLFLIGRRVQRKSPWIRQICSFVSRQVVFFLFARGVSDVNCPYRLMRTDAFKDVFLNLTKDMATPNILIAGIAAQSKMKIFETDVVHTCRKTGTVSLKSFKLFLFSVKSFLQIAQFRFSLTYRKLLSELAALEKNVVATH